MAPGLLWSPSQAIISQPPRLPRLCISQAFPRSALLLSFSPRWTSPNIAVYCGLVRTFQLISPAAPPSLHEPLPPVTMTVPSIGDILMVSQVGWKIGRAFSAGRKGAPLEFQEIEAEIGGLAKALKLLAETLHAESEQNLFQSADREIQDGIGTILSSCQRTVNDLDSLIDHHQVIRKHRTVGGFAIERSWSNLVLAEYKTMMWTTDGGDLQNLKDVLQMHTSNITLLMQALQRLVIPLNYKKRWANMSQQITGTARKRCSPTGSTGG